MYQYKAKVINVVDGDTVDAVVDLGFKIHTTQRFRLARIDTPERGQAGFIEAKIFVTDAVLNKEVMISTEKVSKFGYYLAEITLDTGDKLNDVLIKEGLAKPYDGGKKE